jgi:serine/threonine protein kinase/Flp pilus assembly protein TadD
MKCPKCETVNPPNSKFCRECATPLPLSAKEQASFTRTLETKTDELTRGEVFAGRYEIIEELGAGGMGRVYRVHDNKLNEEVALKLIRPEIGADKRTVERFHNEIKIARRISHKNICRIHDFHEEGKTLYLTMEYVRGEDLKSLIHRTKALTVGASLFIAHQIAEGLAEAHKLGIVHRDLKPGNVMIDKEGQAKIMDFGIARAIYEKGITGEGAIIGTPEYMSPEQVEGKEADQRSDIYALGVILFEMVTGQVPFEGETPFSIANKHKSEPPPIPKKLVPQMPEGLNKLILLCLEKDRAKRYQTAEELIADLAAIEESLPTAERIATKRKTSTHRQVTVKFEPRKLIIPAAAVLVFAVAGFLVWRYLIPKPAPPILSAKPTLAVLYFKNNSADPALDLWKENLPVLLTSGLNQSRYLRVLDDSQVYGILKKLNLSNSNKFTPEELKNIATEGGATHLVSGNYFSAGGKFVINISLVDAMTGTARTTLAEEAPDTDGIVNLIDGLAKKIKIALNIPEEPVEESTYKMVGDVYTRSPKALQYYFEGEKAGQNGDYLKAMPAFEKAIALDPEFAMAYRAMGAHYWAIGNFAQGYGYKKKAFELRNKLPEKDRLIVEGTWYVLREETLPKALDAFRKAADRYPDDFQARFQLAGWTYDNDESIRQYETLLHGKGQTESTILHVNLVTRYSLKGNYGKAREDLEEYIKLFPQDVWGHWALGNIFMLEKNLDAAQKEYEKAVALALISLPQEPYWPSLFAEIDWNKGNPDKALQIIEVNVKTQKDPSIYDDWWYPWLFMMKGKFKATFDLRDKVEKKALSSEATNKSRSEMMTIRAKDFIQAGQAEKALEKIRSGLEFIRKDESQFPDTGMSDMISARRRLMIWQVCALCDLGQFKEADIIQREIESLIPKFIKKDQKQDIDMIGSFPAGKIALAKKDSSTAVRKLEESLHELYCENYFWTTDHAYILDLLGDAYQTSGQIEKAAETYARIKELTFGRRDWGAIYTRSYYKLGKVLVQLGKKAEAREKFIKFLDLWKDADPGLPEVEDAKKRLAAL